MGYLWFEEMGLIANEENEKVLQPPTKATQNQNNNTAMLYLYSD